MKFALVNNERQEAQPGLIGNCIYCGNQTIAKCGINHFLDVDNTHKKIIFVFNLLLKTLYKGVNRNADWHPW